MTMDTPIVLGADGTPETAIEILQRQVQELEECAALTTRLFSLLALAVLEGSSRENLNQEHLQNLVTLLGDHQELLTKWLQYMSEMEEKSAPSP